MLCLPCFVRFPSSHRWICGDTSWGKPSKIPRRALPARRSGAPWMGEAQRSPHAGQQVPIWYRPFLFSPRHFLGFSFYVRDPRGKTALSNWGPTSRPHPARPRMATFDMRSQAESPAISSQEGACYIISTRAKMGVSEGVQNDDKMGSQVVSKWSPQWGVKTEESRGTWPIPPDVTSRISCY